MYVNREKYEFTRAKIMFLCHLMDKDMLRMDLRKVHVILD